MAATVNSYRLNIAIAQATVLDLDTLREMKAEAAENLEAAWKAQQACTVDEGYTYAQAQDAIRRALEVEGTYRAICAMYNAALAAHINSIEDAPIDVTPLGGW